MIAISVMKHSSRGIEIVKQMIRVVVYEIYFHGDWVRRGLDVVGGDRVFFRSLGIVGSVSLGSLSAELFGLFLDEEGPFFGRFFCRCNKFLTHLITFIPALHFSSMATEYNMVQCQRQI